MCGAAASSDSTRCEHCGSRLATVACPSCFGMMFVGAKFCSHCGARADRAELANEAQQPCPRCKTPMEAVLIGNMNLRECPRCEGIWADADSLEQLCADREKQSAVLGVATHLPANQSMDVEQNIRYVPCPVCNKLMNRVNFAHCSNVVVDVCKGHGTWFDKDELRKIVEFIRSGGLESARAKEMADLEQRKREFNASKVASGWGGLTPDRATNNYDHWAIGLSAAAFVLKTLLR
jgi:Zn-finger nucleic acid-binding protein